MRRPSLATLLLGLLLLAMAAGQLADVSGFADILGTYELFGEVEEASALLVPALELLAAAGLLGSRVLPPALGRGAEALGLAVALFWTALGAQAFARGLLVENCGCFGVYLGQELRWWVLVQDFYFVALVWYAAAATGLGLPLPRLRAMRTP